MKKYKEVISGTIIFIFAAVYFGIGLTIPEFNDGFISSDFMPKLYGIILMALSAVQIFMGAKGLKNEGEDQKEGGSFLVPEVVITFVFLVLYVALLNVLGFLFSTILFLLGMVTLFTPKEKRNIIKIVLISVVFSVVVYLIFVKGFGLTLPEGFFG
ncbi:MAG: tripartite tricarboxylate transporter TctB family protein [Eubacteriales bacterium]|nr:tripartite tricarboxylate transporter TctB family protein [Eubacteriales bacterium]